METPALSKGWDVIWKWLKEWILWMNIDEWIQLKSVSFNDSWCYCRAQRRSSLKHQVICSSWWHPPVSLFWGKCTWTPGCSEEERFAGCSSPSPKCCFPQFPQVMFRQLHARSLQGLLVRIILEYIMPQSCPSRAGNIKAKQGSVEGYKECQRPSGASREPRFCGYLASVWSTAVM